LLATACEKWDPTGQDRFNPAHRGVALAGASTLNRLELSNKKQTRAHKLAHDPAKTQACLLQMGVRCLPKQATEIVLDWDAMGHRLCGMQEGRHYRAYYDEYCYLPLYVFAEDTPLWAQPRTSDRDGAEGVVAALKHHRAGDSATLPPCPHPRARRQRLLPGGDGLVPKAAGGLLLSGLGPK
jgi:Transposase DDE domain group 1